MVKSNKRRIMKFAWRHNLIYPTLLLLWILLKVRLFLFAVFTLRHQCTIVHVYEILMALLNVIFISTIYILPASSHQNFTS